MTFRLSISAHRVIGGASTDRPWGIAFELAEELPLPAVERQPREAIFDLRGADEA